jgi:short-subunit dehydrogenase
MNSRTEYAIVTGATSGIGYELAKLLAQDRYNLIVVARDENELARVAGEFNDRYDVDTIAISKDLFNPENAFALYDEIKRVGVDVDILINDAGQGHYGEFKDTDIRRELDIINLNISSLVVLTKLYLQDMVQKGHGRIMNLSSVASKAPGPWHSVYHGTKAFVQSFTEAIRSELKDTGVTVTALLPGATATDFFNKADMNEAKIVQEGKLDNAADVAKDGYDALMNGDDMVVSGFKNKVQVAMSGLTPDSTLAEKMKKTQEPVKKSKVKKS